MIAADFAEVEFVQSQDNIGFGRSNNLGFTRVTGETVLLLNPDTEIRPGAIQTCWPSCSVCLGPALSVPVC